VYKSDQIHTYGTRAISDYNQHTY